MLIAWWSARVVVRRGRRVRQTLIHTVGGSGTVPSCPPLRCLKVVLWTPRRFLCSFFVRLRNHHFSSLSCTKLFWSLELPTVDNVREMPYLPRDAHVDPAGVSVRSNTASLHSTAIVEFVAARKDACLFLLKRPPVAGVSPVESNAVSQHSVNGTDAEAFAGQICLMLIPLERSVFVFTEHGNCGICKGQLHLAKLLLGRNRCVHRKLLSTTRRLDLVTKSCPHE